MSLAGRSGLRIRCTMAATAAAPIFPQGWWIVSVGRQDFLYQADKQFAEALKAKGVNVTYKETEGGHFWNIWRNNIHEAAQMLFAPRR